MKQEDIVKLRDECDQWAEDHLQCKGEYHPDFHTVSDERFATLVTAAEREACAQVADEFRRGAGNPVCAEVAAAIRARKEQA